MNKKLTMFALVTCIGLVAFGHHGWNHMLGIEAIRGVSYVLGGAVSPAPVVVAPPTTVVAPAPVVTTTPVVTTVPSYSYGYYNNVYCPTYSGYYYYNNAWMWGGPRFGHRPPPPVWRPHHFHHGPGPGFHHGGFHHGGPHHGGPHHRR